ncbi:MAG: hypothetical protein C4516_07445 [Oxalobacter sp.]|nr:MAG: hypothetical protein C4516_07445 [Oxalobacter sp.]
MVQAHAVVSSGERLYIDAGVAYLRMRVCDSNGHEIENHVISSNRDLRDVIAEYRLDKRMAAGAQAIITGKLASLVKQALGGGHTFLQASALWMAAKTRAKLKNEDALALVEISASGFTLVGVDGQGRLREDLLVTNPRCGAGTGVNIDRVLQKLGMKRDDVDVILADYLGYAGRALRDRIGTRVDRCGVFGASATISDKNQGIPLSVALATTFKSELQKVITKLPEGFNTVMLVGRFFNWQFVRDCAEDFLRELGVKHIEYDPDNTLMLDALHDLAEHAGVDERGSLEGIAFPEPKLNEYPSFAALLTTMEGNLRYRREPTGVFSVPAPRDLATRPVHIGMDVGSTMAKVVMTDDAGEIVFLDAYSNAGDTIETVKRVFSDLQEQGLSSLQVRSIGVTGSARYQVREALARIYPQLTSRLAVLVENYAHARGSIDQAREHLVRLKTAGVTDLNEDFCILVDIGGEDTKISTIAMREAELFSNAMNIKCSAGTGSLMDTLSALFGIPGAGEASRLAFEAERGLEINATCAVFLIENAQKLQAQGVPRGEILASASWAIVENMARTLWSQVELPGRTVVLLHGQTMLSDPLPLAVSHRLESYLGEPAYCLVPTYPGHRACLGLIRTLSVTAPAGAVTVPFSALLDAKFEKVIIKCRGIACEDPSAACNRTGLRCHGSDGNLFAFTLGGCSAVNEMLAKYVARKEHGVAMELTAPPRDTYMEIWSFIDSHHPRTENARRLVIPRGFIVSEWAYFLSRIFERFDIPVHVDNVCDTDLVDAQPYFDVDSCAPHMGAVGQFLRLAQAPHGMILAPQIELLQTDGKSMGRTCTLNQGGFAVAKGVAEAVHQDARFHLFHIDLSKQNAENLADQLQEQFAPVFAAYGMAPSRRELVAALAGALNDHRALRVKTAELAGDMIEQANAAGQKVALVVGREYLLNPGIYDSHVRRLLRDKAMVAIPSYVLDVELNEDFAHIYWRNPHLITTILAAVADRSLHQRIRQPRLAALFEELEASTELLPVVQVSTFCCGPDSVTLPLGAELMKQRPFLLIQSDAVIKELAHLENRVNTYVNQLNMGLHAKLKPENEEAFDVKALDDLESNEGIDPARDVIYFPTLSDSRPLSSIMRGAGFACVDLYRSDRDLQGLIKSGRRSVGDAVCAPLAAVYADLERAKADFARRRAQNDPVVAGKTRLLFFDNAGTGPCRQGQYVHVHKLMAHKDMQRESQECKGEGVFRFLIARERDGYNIGLEEWTLLRMYQATIVQGALHDLLFTASMVCRDAEEYGRFLVDYAALKEELLAAYEKFSGPGSVARMLCKVFGTPAKYWAYRLDGRDLVEPFRKFAARWPQRKPEGKPLDILATGEVYMRVAQAEAIFTSLLSMLGFGRFKMHVAPVWSYLDYLVEQADAEIRTTPQADLKAAKNRRKRITRLRWVLRNLIAKPVYDAAGLTMPTSANEHMITAQEVLPTLRPFGELAPYLGEVIGSLRQGANLILNVAPTSCMVSTMSQVFTPRLRQVGCGDGHVQQLFSADGEVNDELLSLALLKSMGPEGLARRGASEGKETKIFKTQSGVSSLAGFGFVFAEAAEWSWMLPALTQF